MPSLLARGHALSPPHRQAAILAATGAPDFDRVLLEQGIPALTTGSIDVLQVNVGRVCNQLCAHCHVDAGPDRRESMDEETASLVLEALRRFDIPTLDITGGAPEMNPNFRELVRGARALGRRVIDRCNLTILLTAPHADLAAFLAEHDVEIMASLPSFRALGTDTQRGSGVFSRSIEALRRLNALGYGRSGKRILGLVYNPVGAFLPGDRASLESEYRRELESRHGVTFDHLHAMTNMPISRYLEFLDRSGNLRAYMELLVGSFNPEAVGDVMCRTHLSVSHDGRLFDCDFNQMLDLAPATASALTLRELIASGDLRRRIQTGRHCFGCTAGAGSSCGG